MLRATVEALTGPDADEEGLPPLTGGLVGFLSYDLVRRFERLPQLAEDDLHVPELGLFLATDLVVLDRAPLYLAGRIALRGRLLFDDDPPARVAWEADTRLQYLDEKPYIDRMSREYLEGIAARGGR